MNDELDFEISDIEKEEQFDSFIEFLKELKGKPHVKMFNPYRMKEFHYACNTITKIVKAENPDAKIEYSINDGDASEGVIRIVADEICIKDLRG